MSDKEQIDRFKEAARQIGADESSDALDKAFGMLDLQPKSVPSDQKKKNSGHQKT